MALALMSILGGAKAQEYYDVWGCSKQLTSKNIGDIVGMANTFLATQGLGLITGTITYDPATKTMTLDNVTANTDDYMILDFKNDNYTLVVKGTNTLTSQSHVMGVQLSDLTITGGGTPRLTTRAW